MSVKIRPDYTIEFEQNNNIITAQSISENQFTVVNDDHIITLMCNISVNNVQQ